MFHWYILVYGTISAAMLTFCVELGHPELPSPARGGIYQVEVTAQRTVV